MALLPDSFTPLRWLRAGGLAVVAALLGHSHRIEAAPVAETVDRYGELEVVTRGVRQAAGDSGRSTTMSSFSLRWRGQPVVIDTRSGLGGEQVLRTSTVHAVYVLGRSENADMLVLVGDPNNTGAFHLVRRSGGSDLSTPLVCLVRAGDNAVAWLDEAVPDRGPWHGPQHRVIDGGGLLSLGSACLWDVQARQALALPPPDGVALWARALALLSPDRRSLVRIGSPDPTDEERRSGQAAHPPPSLLVGELQPIGTARAGRWQVIKLDPGRMHYTSDEMIDSAWVLHHFRWQRDADGRDRLVERSDFKPLPRLGALHPRYNQFNLREAVADVTPVMAEFLQRRFGAQAVPLQPHQGADEAGRTWRVRGETVQLTGDGLYIEQATRYWPGQTGDPALQRQLIVEIAKAFNDELLAGRHQALFGPVRP